MEPEKKSVAIPEELAAVMAIDGEAKAFFGSLTDGYKRVLLRLGRRRKTSRHPAGPRRKSPPHAAKKAEDLEDVKGLWERTPRGSAPWTPAGG